MVNYVFLHFIFILFTMIITIFSHHIILVFRILNVKGGGSRAALMIWVNIWRHIAKYETEGNILRHINNVDRKSQLFICSMQIKSKIRKWFVNKSPSCTLYTYVKDDISSMFVSYSDNDDERLLVILHFLSIIKHVSCTWTVLKTYWKLWQKMERQRCTCYFSSESSFCKGVSIFFNTYS